MYSLNPNHVSLIFSHDSSRVSLTMTGTSDSLMDRDGSCIFLDQVTFCLLPYTSHNTDKKGKRKGLLTPTSMFAYRCDDCAPLNGL